MLIEFLLELGVEIFHLIRPLKELIHDLALVYLLLDHRLSLLRRELVLLY